MQTRSGSQVRLSKSLEELCDQYAKGEIDIQCFLNYYQRLSPQAREIHLPDNFNVAHVLKDIATQHCWGVQGQQLLWTVIPEGVKQIASSSADSLRELAVISQIQCDKNMLLSYWRKNMTNEFYQLILCLDKLAVSNGVHYVAINAYCKRWSQSGVMMPGTMPCHQRRSISV